MEKVRVGCCGWSFFSPGRFIGEDWKKRYKSVLQAYASLFHSVEVNSTFYRLPKVSTAERWKEEVREVNKSFEFTVKVHQDITHRLKFGRESLDVFERVAEIAGALDAKVLVFQTPASFKPTEENITRVVEFFEEVRRDGFIFVWEVRWQDVWSEEVVRELFSKIGVEHAVDPFRQESYYNPSIFYYRLHGLGKRMYDYKFSDDELAMLGEKVMKKVKEGKSAYVMFNNYEMYDDALKFMKVVREWNEG